MQNNVRQGNKRKEDYKGGERLCLFVKPRQEKLHQCDIAWQLHEFSVIWNYEERNCDCRCRRKPSNQVLIFKIKLRYEFVVPPFYQSLLLYIINATGMEIELQFIIFG